MTRLNNYKFQTLDIIRCINILLSQIPFHISVFKVMSILNFNNWDSKAEGSLRSACKWRMANVILTVYIDLEECLWTEHPLLSLVTLYNIYVFLSCSSSRSIVSQSKALQSLLPLLKKITDLK